MRGDIADLRTRSIGELWQADHLSLGRLAARIGVSKARADHLNPWLQGTPPAGVVLRVGRSPFDGGYLFDCRYPSQFLPRSR